MKDNNTFDLTSVLNQASKIVYLYERLSKDDGIHSQKSNSIVNQEKTLERKCQELGITDYVHISDDGISGTTLNRPGIQKIINDVMDNKVETLIVKDLNRLTRNVKEGLTLFDDYLTKKKVRFISVIDEIDSGVNGEKTIDIDVLTPHFLAGEMESKKRSQSVKEAARNRLDDGKPLSGIAPYGYININGDYLIDDEAQRIVLEIFNTVKSGKSINSICKDLTNRNILTPERYRKENGIAIYDNKEFDCYNQWNVTNLKRMLCNKVYIGHLEIRKTKKQSYKSKEIITLDKPEKTVENHHEPIISIEDFEIVQQIVNDNRKQRPTKTGYEPILKDIVFDEHNHKMYFQYNGNRKGYNIFQCSMYNRGKQYCNNHYIHEEELNKAVINDIKDLFGFIKNDEQRFIDIMSTDYVKLNNSNTTAKQKEITKLRLDIEKINNRKMQTYEDYQDGKIDNDLFNTALKKYKSESIEKKALLEKLQNDLSVQQVQNNKIDVFMDIIHKYENLNIETIDQAFIRQFIEKVIVYPKGENKIDIVYRFIGLLHQ